MDVFKFVDLDVDQPNSEHETLEAAWIAMAARVRSHDGISLQWLETMIWIECNGKHVAHFYEAKELAYSEGWMI